MFKNIMCKDTPNLRKQSPQGNMICLWVLFVVNKHHIHYNVIKLHCKINHTAKYCTNWTIQFRMPKLEKIKSFFNPNNDNQMKHWLQSCTNQLWYVYLHSHNYTFKKFASNESIVSEIDNKLILPLHLTSQAAKYDRLHPWKHCNNAW